MASVDYRKLVGYQAPEFARSLPKVPKHRVKLAMLPTPIHEWHLPGVPPQFELFIKRDDLTGSLLSGNKIRKLEFLLGEALERGCDTIITCGSVTSNHCRATAVAAKELGLDCHLLLRSKNFRSQDAENPGNLLPSIFSGCRLYFVPYESDFNLDIYERQERLSKQIKNKTGKSPFYIPLGGSNVEGVFGYLEAWDEMVKQNILETIDDVFVACGSVGTLSGLCIANYLTGQKIKIHAVNIKKDQEYPHQFINSELDALNLTEVRAADLVDFIHNYCGEGHGKSTRDDHNFIQQIAKDTGIFCDHIYTGKVVKGMLSEMRINPSRFRGNRVLFMHTGGTLGLYDGTFQPCLDETLTSNAYTWEKPEDEPKPIADHDS